MRRDRRLAIRAPRFQAIAWTLALTVALACRGGDGFIDRIAPAERGRQPCDDAATSPTYEAVQPGTLDIELVDCGLVLATRMKFDPSGQALFVSLLSGVVYVYHRTPDDTWRRQERPVFDLGHLGLSNEAGLTGLFFGADFDLAAPQAERRDLFLTYQQRVWRKNRNRITRITLVDDGGEYIGTDPARIYTSPDETYQSHQVQDGMSFMYQGAPHILVSFGDGRVSATALDMEYESSGKMLLMQRDGSDPLGTRPWPDHPKAAAIGLRNTFGVLMLPPSIDSTRRVLGVENGEIFQDRIWLYEIIDFGGEVNGRANLGYAGSDSTTDWTEVFDINTPGPVKRPAVLFPNITPSMCPTSVALHPGKGFIQPPSQGEIVFVAAFFGDTRYPVDGPGKNIQIARVGNLDGPEYEITGDLTPIIQKKGADENVVFGHPVAMDVDPLSHDIFFADIMTGEMNRARIGPHHPPQN